MIVVAEQKLSSHSVMFSSSKLHLGMQSAGVLLSCFWFVSILAGYCQQNKDKMHAKMYLHAVGRELHFWWGGRLACRLCPADGLCSISPVIFQLDRRWCICLRDHKVDLLTSPSCSRRVWLLCYLKLTNPWQSKASIHCELLLYIQTPTFNITIKVSLCLWHKMALNLLKDGCD